MSITKLPARLEPFGDIGWTVFEFKTTEDAASWFKQNPQAAMPCWKRLAVVNGRLEIVR